MFNLNFEEKIIALEEKLIELQKKNCSNQEILNLQLKLNKEIEKAYSKLKPHEHVMIARNQNRPTGLTYIQSLIKDFTKISGDRLGFDDHALICGIGKFEGISVAVIGNNKGDDFQERIKNNFGMAHPEGYRKVLRLFDLANKFNLPILSFIDTKGAAANKASEERGQAFALATCIERSFNLEVPLISVIVGEGGSGGAIALACAHSLMMLSYSVFSVISADACASILWKDRAFWQEAASALKLTCKDLIKQKVIDKEIKEPFGGAHRFPKETIENVKQALKEELKKLMKLSSKELKTLQKNKFENF